MSDAPQIVVEKKKGGCFRWIGIAVVAFAVIAVIAAVAGGGGDAEKTTTEDRKAAIVDDVTIGTCAADAGNYLVAEVTAKNNSSKRSNYIITVAFESPDGSEQFDTAIAAINGLAPEQSATETAQTLTEASGEFTCKVTDVTRLSAEG